VNYVLKGYLEKKASIWDNITYGLNKALTNPVIPIAAGGLLGSGIGAFLDPENRFKGAVKGFTYGAGIPAGAAAGAYLPSSISSKILQNRPKVENNENYKQIEKDTNISLKKNPKIRDKNFRENFIAQRKAEIDKITEDYISGNVKELDSLKIQDKDRELSHANYIEEQLKKMEDIKNEYERNERKYAGSESPADLSNLVNFGNIAGGALGGYSAKRILDSLWGE